MLRDRRTVAPPLFTFWGQKPAANVSCIDGNEAKASQKNRSALQSKCKKQHVRHYLTPWAFHGRNQAGNQPH
jgi:hypothetical protein